MRVIFIAKLVTMSWSIFFIPDLIAKAESNSVTITPLIRDYLDKGFIVDKSIELQQFYSTKFHTPKLENNALPINDAELLLQNTSVMLTQNGNEYVQLSKKISLEELKRWEKIKSDPDSSSSPNENDRITESINGEDTRSQVTNTTMSPWRAIGLVGTHCTGALIGPRHVLTAAHCLYDTDTDKWMEDLRFTPAINGEIKPFAPISWKNALTTKGYTEAHNINYDYAILILNEPIGNKIGWFNFGYNYNETKLKLNTAGYPGDKPFGTMWRTGCDVTNLDYSRPMYDFKCDIWGGQSGSPMWTYKAPNSRIIRGIVTYQSIVRFIASETSSNTGNLITATVYNTLKKWQTENP